MSKQKAFHKYIYKLHSSRLAEAKWDLILPLQEAMDNKTDIVELADSQCLRFIDEINKVDTFQKTKQLKDEISHLKSKERTSAINRKIKKLYYELYSTQFQSDYVCIVMDNMKQYDRCNKGFTINGVKYRRFLGTNGGIKNSTIIYVSERIYPELKERLDCGRDKTKELIPAKLEAYQALMCSGSIPVSMPHGIIVVNDCTTNFTDNVIYVDDSETDEPVVQYLNDHKVKFKCTDGFGLMLPSLSKRWSEELNNEPDKYLTCVNTRGIPWTKGMLYTFDFIEFAEKKAHGYLIKDAWGDIRDVRNAEVILTTSMFKLWKSYKNWEEFEANFTKYNYQYAVSKTSPYVLDEERTTNYQFLQSYELTDDDLKELVDPTLNTIKEVIGLDYRKTMLYMKGSHISSDDLFYKNAGIAEALMIEPRLIDDPYIRSTIYDSIKTRIRRAKIGVLDVKGNFAIIAGDPYILCESMFEMIPQGLLPAHMVYHKFWSDKGVDEICLFRAPMTSHNNIRKQKVANPGNAPNFEEMQHWYQYIETSIIFNAWDTTAESLNGADMDGDLCFTTNDPVLLRNTRSLPAIYCIEREAVPKVVTEADIIEANKLSFGDAIGSTTNVITSQICALSNFEKGTKEYKELEYRVLCGQLYQQGSIDKAKGIICKPMPAYWYSLKGLKIEEGDTEEEKERKRFLKRISVNKKPYFFIYNYDTEYSRYNKFMEHVNRSCIREYSTTLEELIAASNRTAEQDMFLNYYYQYLPVDKSPCTINRICWYVEDEIDELIKTELKGTNNDFDYTILKTPNKRYTKDQYYPTKKLLEKEYTDYRQGVQELVRELNEKEIHGTEKALMIKNYSKSFMFRINLICPDEEMLCDALLDIGYKSNVSKKFIWEICGSQIIKNLLKRKNGEVSYPVQIVNSEMEGEQDFCFKGVPYRMEHGRITTLNISDDELECEEFENE